MFFALPVSKMVQVSLPLEGTTADACGKKRSLRRWLDGNSGAIRESSSGIRRGWTSPAFLFRSLQSGWATVSSFSCGYAPGRRALASGNHLSNTANDRSSAKGWDSGRVWIGCRSSGVLRLGRIECRTYRRPPRLLNRPTTQRQARRSKPLGQQAAQVGSRPLAIYPPVLRAFGLRGNDLR
jgi:hypothetical protein